MRSLLMTKAPICSQVVSVLLYFCCCCLFVVVYYVSVCFCCWLLYFRCCRCLRSRLFQRFCPLPCSALAVSLLFVVVAFCSSWSLEYIAVVVRVFYFFMFVYFAFVVVAIFAVVPQVISVVLISRNAVLQWLELRSVVVLAVVLGLVRLAVLLFVLRWIRLRFRGRFSCDCFLLRFCGSLCRGFGCSFEVGSAVFLLYVCCVVCLFRLTCLCMWLTHCNLNFTHSLGERQQGGFGCVWLQFCCGCGIGLDVWFGGSFGCGSGLGLPVVFSVVLGFVRLWFRGWLVCCFDCGSGLDSVMVSAVSPYDCNSQITLTHKYTQWVMVDGSEGG